MYEIIYFDPSDEVGKSVKTWQFISRKEVENWRKELEIIWRTSRREIKIHSINMK